MEIYERCLFHDILDVEEGSALQFTTSRDCILNNEGIASIPGETLNLLRLSEGARVDRCVRHRGKWIRVHSPYHRPRPGLLRTGDDGLVFSSPSAGADENSGARTCLVVATFSRRGEENHNRVLAVNDEPVAFFGAPPQSCLGNNFQEIVELRDGDRIDIKECYFQRGEDGWQSRIYLGEKEQRDDWGYGHLAVVLLER